MFHPSVSLPLISSPTAPIWPSRGPPLHFAWQQTTSKQKEEESDNSNHTPQQSYVGTTPKLLPQVEFLPLFFFFFFVLIFTSRATFSNHSSLRQFALMFLIHFYCPRPPPSPLKKFPAAAALRNFPFDSSPPRSIFLLQHTRFLPA